MLVTGSRIRRQDFTANAPIVTLDEAVFDDTGTIGNETIMNQLPQFVPAITQFNAGEADSSAITTLGATTVSLRGLGPGGSPVYEPLGRRAFLSLTMDF